MRKGSYISHGIELDREWEMWRGPSKTHLLLADYRGSKLYTWRSACQYLPNLQTRVNLNSDEITCKQCLKYMAKGK